MSYSNEQLKRLFEDCATLSKRKYDLLRSYTARQYKHERALEYARHGFCRRVRIMERCIHNVFQTLPPDDSDVPDAVNVIDGTINLQAFLFNTFGSIENLANIWVLEEGVERQDGKPLSPVNIGFGPKYKTVMASLPVEFRSHLTGIEAWLSYLRNFRHALAHRIPLYIPPSFVPDENADEYRGIEDRINDAIRQNKFDQVGILEEEQNTLVSFIPVTTHSFEERAGLVFFHGQMLEDFRRLEEVAGKMLDALS